jgi:hypothetical protein
MHVLFIHPNFPAQFGHVADRLARHHGYRCTFVSAQPPAQIGNLERILYRTRGGATPQTHYCSRTFENAVWHTHAVYEALKARPDVRPDLVVAHSGFGSSLFLRELYDCPVINYFEYFYRTTDSDLDFRPDFPPTEMTRLRARARNAMPLLDLENCDKGYSPTRWQRDRLPAAFRDKVRVIFDGVDTRLWRPLPACPRRLGGLTFPAGVRLVTYATRGMESMRGFDLFMKMAKKLCDRRQDVLFLIAGQDRVCYDGRRRGSAPRRTSHLPCGSALWGRSGCRARQPDLRFGAGPSADGRTRPCSIILPTGVLLPTPPLPVKATTRAGPRPPAPAPARTSSTPSPRATRLTSRDRARRSPRRKRSSSASSMAGPSRDERGTRKTPADLPRIPRLSHPPGPACQGGPPLMMIHDAGTWPCEWH